MLAAAAVAAYSGTYSVPALFDDRPTILHNDTIRQWATALEPPKDTTASGRPILNLSLAVNYAISGIGLWSYHAFNLTVHVFAGLTLFGIVRRLLVRVPRAAALSMAFCTAALWILHPLQTEAVTYVVQRAESLMGLFYLQTVYWFVRSQEPNPGSPSAVSAAAGAPDRGPTRFLCLFLSVSFCALGMGTKEVMISAPIVVLLLDRLCFAGSAAEAWRRRRPYYVAIAATSIPLLFLVWRTGIFADLILHTGNRSQISGEGSGASAWQYWATQPEALIRYLGLAVWPRPLVLDYGTQWLWSPGHPASPGVILARLFVPAALVVVLAAAALRGLLRNTASGFLGFCFFAILAPTSVIPGDRQTAADHRMYLALAAVAFAAALGIHRRMGRAALPVCMVLAVALGWATFLRNQDYSSELSIWSDTVAKCPGNYFARFNLGSVLLGEPGRLDEAIAQYEEALRLRPDSVEGHIDLGNALSNAPGRLGEAIAQYGEALRLKPDHFGAHLGMGNALMREPGRLNEAIAHLGQAVSLKPDFPEARFNLGNALAMSPGRLDEAIAQYREALRLKPDFAVAHFSLAAALLRRPGATREAEAHLERGLQLDPNDALARQLLGRIRAPAP